MAEGGELGMTTMEQDLKRLFDEGKISKEETINNANNKKRIKELMNYVD
jgi:twitching motility protein PilT